MVKQRVTQLLEKAKISSKFPSRQLETLGVTYVGDVSGHGSGLYVRIPREICDYFGITSGDKIKIGLLQRKRWTDIEEK
jgi:hypothetical protein